MIPDDYDAELDVLQDDLVPDKNNFSDPPSNDGLAIQDNNDDGLQALEVLSSGHDKTLAASKPQKATISKKAPRKATPLEQSPVNEESPEELLEVCRGGRARKASTRIASANKIGRSPVKPTSSKKCVRKGEDDGQPPKNKKVK